jgi:hypothetical protein
MKLVKTIYASKLSVDEFIVPVRDKTSFKLGLKVHKNENCFGSDFELCTISLLVMSKY